MTVAPIFSYRLREDNSKVNSLLSEAERERDFFRDQVKSYNSGTKDDVYETQIKKVCTLKNNCKIQVYNLIYS